MVLHSYYDEYHLYQSVSRFNYHVGEVYLARSPTTEDFTLSKMSSGPLDFASHS